ncbi:WD40 repeat domain-containing protein [Cryptosporangium sp. NPDC048952]|uniref:WD40 repeat domain-containing protein n=1 Tax=Cryptosporangium sp. NPDC048952 TaxID=3363961 RepID=UPI0037182199
MLAKLPLDSPLWLEFDACFSTEQALESLREVLTRRQLGEPWDSLRSELLHQGTVYDVTSAAIPHLVDLAPSLDAEERAELWTEIGFWVTAGADYYEGPPAEGLQESVTAAIGVAETGALEVFRERAEFGGSYFALACVTLAGHPSGGAMWSFLSPGEAYVTLTCPGCEEQDEVDGFGDPLGPPCAPPPVPDLAADARSVPGWISLAEEIEAARELFGPGWEEFARVAVRVARAGVPETTPPAAVWCLIAAMVALRGDAAWGRTIARLAGHYQCVTCEDVYWIGDLIAEDEFAEPVDAAGLDPATFADANGFKPAPRGWPRSAPAPLAQVRWRAESGPITALTAATLHTGQTILAGVGPDGLDRWDLTTGTSLPATGTSAAGGAAAASAPGGGVAVSAGGGAASVTMPDGRAYVVAGGDAFRWWDVATGELLSARPGAIRAVAPAVVPAPVHGRHPDDPGWLADLRDGRTVVVTGHADGSVQLWDPVAAEPLGELYRTGEIRALTSVPDVTFGDQVVAVSGELTVDVWSSAAVTGQRSTMAPSAPRLAAIGHRTLVGVAGTPGGIALADGDGRVSLWTTFGVRLGDPLPPDPAHTGVGAVAALTTADDTLVVATVSAPDHNLRLWTPTTGGTTLIDLDATPRTLWAAGTVLVVGTDTGVVALGLEQLGLEQLGLEQLGLE